LRRRCCGTLANAKAKHFALVRFEHLKAMAFEIDGVAGRGNFAKDMA
jgi:hypothetical protein